MISLLDNRDQTHTLDLDAALVDGARCLTLELDDTQLRLITEATTITCAFDEFWRAIAGLDPTPIEAGRLLAHCFAQQIHLLGAVQHLQDIESLVTQALSQMQVPLSLGWLQHRLDPLTRKAMEAYDDSEAMTQAIARILNQTPETIRAWAVELGYVVVLPNGSAETPAETKRFRWSEQRLQQLEEAMTRYPNGTVIERSQQIAEHYGWPVEKVRSKLYEMQKPSHQNQPVAREAEPASKEDD